MASKLVKRIATLPPGQYRLVLSDDGKVGLYCVGIVPDCGPAVTDAAVIAHEFLDRRRIRARAIALRAKYPSARLRNADHDL